LDDQIYFLIIKFSLKNYFIATLVCAIGSTQANTLPTVRAISSISDYIGCVYK